VLDDLSTGRREHLRAVRDRIRFIRGNVARLEVCRRAMQDVDYVFHQAAVTSVPRSLRKPLAAHHTNVTGTLNVLLAAREAKVRRVVFAGSTAAYGDAAEVPQHEALLPHPRSAYAASKLAAEAYCQASGTRTGSRRWCCDTSTSSDRARTSTRNTVRRPIVHRRRPERPILR